MGNCGQHALASESLCEHYHSMPAFPVRRITDRANQTRAQARALAY